MAQLITTLGPKSSDELGMILPHEHVFVDLRTWDKPGYGEADSDDVTKLMSPEIEKVRALGVNAIIEPSTVGVGRRADILLAVSKATGFPLVVPTGVYREPWLSPWVRDASEPDLAEWMIGELNGQIAETGVRAGWIKVGSTDDGMTEMEAKVLRAAATASIETGATIGSHTVRGHVARAQLDLIESVGASPSRFVWIHTHQEPDVTVHHELARRGAWIEYDGIGEPVDDDRFIDLIRQALDAELGNRLLVGMDRGWYDPAKPGGGTPKPYIYLPEYFLPKLSDAGVDDQTINELMRVNPFNAFAR